VVSEFLPSLSKAHIVRALHVAACFVLQRVDVNTCYSASLLLWRAADTLGCTMQVLSAAAAASAVRTAHSKHAEQPDMWLRGAADLPNGSSHQHGTITL
jgi:hypothetical protein